MTGGFVSFAFFFVMCPLDRIHRFLEKSMYVEHRFFDFNILCPALDLADADVRCLDFRMCISTWDV
jgi:hypothetical protein